MRTVSRMLNVGPLQMLLLLKIGLTTSTSIFSIVCYPTHLGSVAISIIDERPQILRAHPKGTLSEHFQKVTPHMLFPTSLLLC